MTRQEAIAALRAQGIRNPSQQLILDCIRANSTQEWALELPDNAPAPPTEAQQEPTGPGSGESENPAPPRPTSSKSNLKPLLRDRNELVRPAGKRKAGRPRVVAAFFPALARLMSDGTSLRAALGKLGIYGLSAKELRSLYRNRELRQLREHERLKFQSEYGLRKRRTARKGLRQLLRSL